MNLVDTSSILCSPDALRFVQPGRLQYEFDEFFFGVILVRIFHLGCVRLMWLEVHLFHLKIVEQVKKFEVGVFFLQEVMEDIQSQYDIEM